MNGIRNCLKRRRLRHGAATTKYHVLSVLRTIKLRALEFFVRRRNKKTNCRLHHSDSLLRLLGNYPTIVGGRWANNCAKLKRNQKISMQARQLTFAVLFPEDAVIVVFFWCCGVYNRLNHGWMTSEPHLECVDYSLNLIIICTAIAVSWWLSALTVAVRVTLTICAARPILVV